MDEGQAPRTRQPRTSVASLLRCAVVLVTLEIVLCGKVGGGKSNGKSNGKTFSVTGTWALSETFIEKSRCSNATKGSSGIDCAYKLDARLATCLAHFFRGLTVTELGAGVGRYKTHVDNSGMAREYVAYDGLLNVAELTQGRVQHVDLTVDTPTLRRSDFALSLEVAEHIPAMFEQTLFRNIDRSNRLGIVISWSNMGSSQSAHGHVNPKRKSQVRQLFAPWGYVEDRNASAYLRTCATFLYLKRGIQVMRRTATAANTSGTSSLWTITPGRR